MTLQDVKMTLQSHILKAARILGCTAFSTYESSLPNPPEKIGGGDYNHYKEKGSTLKETFL